MKKPANKNLAASVHDRLLNIARETGRPFNEVLQYYAMERLLNRLSRSSNTDSFVLKGALLFRVWDVPDSRATRDIGFGDKVHPDVVQAKYPVILDLPAPSLRMYPPETVVAAIRI